MSKTATGKAQTTPTNFKDSEYDFSNIILRTFNKLKEIVSFLCLYQIKYKIKKNLSIAPPRHPWDTVSKGTKDPRGTTLAWESREEACGSLHFSNSAYEALEH